MFSINRLELARKRRRYTGKALAEKARISPVTVSRIINRRQDADEETIDALIDALQYPREFFFRDDLDAIDPMAASFRSMTRMTAQERDAALAAGSFAFEMTDWVNQRFSLPEADLMDLGELRDPAAAARLLRQQWGIGERPIGHMVRLLESKGIRVFSLTENTKTVDAFSCWRNAEPFIFLNTFKTTERSRFDAAHELGHLVLHRHGGPQQGREAEAEAQTFASNFLMPPNDLVSTIPTVQSLAQLIKAKRRWGVSVSALAYSLHKLGRISDWNYRTFCIQISTKFGSTEPDPLPSETSSVWQMVLSELWREGVTRNHIAKELSLPSKEIESLLFGLTGDVAPPERTTGRTQLRAVSGGG